ncbi:uncharacterized protein KY384_006226 [Bacidia gigantensis]|uniref:uncharacterized protein n=1 Tax=Bacidia gigantensis TaxID=2732470 RepID=UPI001D03D855|nr:uncharacterized protein KY384_006226 [Bacidia gigantensis]KAG8529589.1 hypothetical protein KY384_006226 [Bacidia gigantensis]
MTKPTATSEDSSGTHVGTLQASSTVPRPATASNSTISTPDAGPDSELHTTNTSSHDDSAIESNHPKTPDSTSSPEYQAPPLSPTSSIRATASNGTPSSGSSSALLPPFQRPRPDSPSPVPPTRAIQAAERAQIAAAFKHAPYRLILLDYDGTLAPLASSPDNVTLHPRQLKVLAALSTVVNTTVYIVSGRPSGFLTNQFGGSCPSVGLVAEHGALWHLVGCQFWQPTYGILSADQLAWLIWVGNAFTGLQNLVQGSWTEKKKVACVWHYRDNQADGERMVDSVIDVLARASCRKGVGGTYRIMKGKDALEMMAVDIGKGSAVEALIVRQEKHRSPLRREQGFVFCAGDDTTDEHMFAAVNAARIPENLKFTVKVRDGPRDKKETAAKWSADGTASIWEVLEDCLLAVGVVVDETEL